MNTPRKSNVITFSLPPQKAEQVRQLMQEEGRTMSELIREALRLRAEAQLTGIEPVMREKTHLSRFV